MTGSYAKIFSNKLLNKHGAIHDPNLKVVESRMDRHEENDIASHTKQELSAVLSSPLEEPRFKTQQA